MKYPFLLVLVITLTACNSNPSTTQSNTDQRMDTTVLADNGPVNDFAASYEGRINNKYDIVMHLTKTGNTLGGTYLYKNKGKAINLKGSITDDGSIELTEMTGDMLTGMFYGKLVDTQITGTWSNPDNSTTMPFEVIQTGIASMLEKGDVLSHAIGEYTLSAITGASGANNMFDTYLQQGKWVSTGSSNIGGQREGYTNDLTKEDTDLLNNLHITVDDRRGVHLYAGLIELFHSPFKAQGMDYRINQKEKTKLNERMAALHPDTVLYGSKYILFADDHMNYNAILHGVFEIVANDNLILTYVPAINAFEIEIFFGDCCDTNVLTFSK
ncbi:MAG: hypothetical protein V4565_14510 [Bacteroidota bacterium]